jgi:hypothetical protein
MRSHDLTPVLLTFVKAIAYFTETSYLIYIYNFLLNLIINQTHNEYD